nr:hypothetical protein [Gemmatimonadota bacterium]
MLRPITLACGETVQIDAFQLSRTYAGLLEGKPHSDCNSRILQRELSSLAARWGARPTYVVPPLMDECEPEHPRLPELMLAVWLYSYTPLQPENHGAELVVLWFRPELQDESLEEVIAAGVLDVPW